MADEQLPPDVEAKYAAAPTIVNPAGTADQKADFNPYARENRFKTSPKRSIDIEKTHARINELNALIDSHRARLLGGERRVVLKDGPEPPTPNLEREIQRFEDEINFLKRKISNAQGKGESTPIPDNLKEPQQGLDHSASPLE
jgi:hypothetical protein